MLGERLWSAEHSSRAYPHRDDFVRACTPILRHEPLLVQDAGADIVQIDDPDLCLFVDPEVCAQHEGPAAASALAVDTANELVDGIDGVKLAVHPCRRAGASVRGDQRHAGGYDPILADLNRLEVHHLIMEFIAPSAGEMTVVRALRDDLEIGLGCVSVQSGSIDTVETIVARVEQALEYLAPERIIPNPGYGFAPGSGAVVDMDEVYQKLQNEAQAARVLRERHS